MSEWIYTLLYAAGAVAVGMVFVIGALEALWLVFAWLEMRRKDDD